MKFTQNLNGKLWKEMKNCLTDASIIFKFMNFYLLDFQAWIIFGSFVSGCLRAASSSRS